MPRVRVRGAEFYFQVQGSEDSFPLVFTHGLGGDHTMWANQAAFFKGLYRVVLWDLRGHGRSEVTEEGYSLSGFVEDLAGLLDRLGIEKAHLAGLSLGSWVSLGFAARYPERTASIILSNSAGVKQGMSGKAVADKRKLFLISAQVAERQGRKAMADNTIQLMFSRGFIERNPGLVALVKKRISEDPGIGYARTIRGVISEYLERPSALPEELASVKAPALVIAGDQDLLTPLATQEALHRALPGSRFALIKDCGHVSALEKPEEWNRIALEFLEEADSLRMS